MPESDESTRSQALPPHHSLPVRTVGWAGALDLVFCHELRLRDMFGARLDITLYELFPVLLARKTLLAMAVISTALMVADPPGLIGLVPFWKILLLWTAGPVAFMAFKFLVLIGIAYLSMRGAVGRVYLPFTSAFQFWVILECAEHFVKTGSDLTFTIGFVGQYAQSLLILILAESIVTHFVIPTIREDRRTAAAIDPPTQAPLGADDSAPRIVVAQRSIRVDQVRFIKSEEHYVRIVLRHETILARSKLADLVAPLPPEAGIQPHRSYWVPRAARPILSKGAKGTGRLRLADGTEIAVARARLRAVQDWLDRHADW